MSNSQRVHSPLSHKDELDDAEKGLVTHTQELSASHTPSESTHGKALDYSQTPITPLSPIHSGLTPWASTRRLSIPVPAKSLAAHLESIEKPTKPSSPAKPKASRWILFVLWFNVYRRFFTFVVTLNLIGIVLAALGRFRYAENHLGALVLGNLLFAILMRNELFVRFLYLVFIYGLRSVRI